MGVLSVDALGRWPIPDRVAMAALVSKAGMALFSRLVWFTAAHYQLAKAAGQDLDYLLSWGRLFRNRYLNHVHFLGPGKGAGHGEHTGVLGRGRQGIL